MKLFSIFPSKQPRRPRRPRLRARRGVVTVEVALCMIFVLLPVTLGGFQFALVFMTQHALQQIARESARYAAVHYSEDTFDANENQGNKPGDARSLKNVIRAQAAANGFAYKEIDGTLLPGGARGSISVTPSNVTGRLSGQPITVTVTYPMKRRALMGSLMFRKEVVKDGKVTGEIDLLRLGFLQNNFSASSTTLME